MALREAIVDSAVHADYAQRGAPIRVAVFDDRVEIENPGLLPPGLTVEDLRRGVSKLRNRVMGRVFQELGLIEQWGSGIQRSERRAGTPACRHPRWKRSAPASGSRSTPRGVRRRRRTASIRRSSMHSRTTTDCPPTRSPSGSHALHARHAHALPAWWSVAWFARSAPARRTRSGVTSEQRRNDISGLLADSRSARGAG